MKEQLRKIKNHQLRRINLKYINYALISLDLVLFSKKLLKPIIGKARIPNNKVNQEVYATLFAAISHPPTVVLQKIPRLPNDMARLLANSSDLGTG
ncbi:hypothetical protein [Maribellus maritimus]|uniref:hypothetical protein n=1 Tax=Maribellus maritimus TaxID=2870838 RepID=UPI001EEAAF57|nr:hypothetical protein [Maribellus maritimus]MCG6191027.1 hypothetical protein [Maribellus maritimus]